MGKQIRVFMTAEDEREFAKFVREDPDTVFIARQTRTSNILEFSYPEEADRSEHIEHRTALFLMMRIRPVVGQASCLSARRTSKGSRNRLEACSITTNT